MHKSKEMLMLLALLVFIIVLSTINYREDSSSLPNRVAPQRSSYHSSSTGYKAAYLAMKELGYPVKRQIRPLGMLPVRGTLVVAEANRTPLSALEGRELLKWLQRGNQAVIFLEQDCSLLLGLSDSPASQMPVKSKQEEKAAWLVAWENKFNPHRVSIEDQMAAIATGSKLPVPRVTTASIASDAPIDLHNSAAELRIKSFARFPKKQLLPAQIARQFSGVTPLYSDKLGVVAVYANCGSGGILFCSSPWSMANQGIKEANNFDLLLALVNRNPQSPLIFDEYHQGYGANMSVWDLAPAKVKFGLSHLLLAFALLIALLSWRFGVIRLPAEERYSHSRAEYLFSLAGLLQRAHASSLVAKYLHNRLSKEMTRKLHLPTKSSSEEIIAANNRHQVVAPAELMRLFQQLAILQQQARPEQANLLRMAHDINQLLVNS